MGKSYGFIREKLEIKILILYILRRLPEPVTLDELTELAMCDEGISYFEFMESLADLVKTEHLYLRDGKYAITAKGARNGEATEKSLPFTIRIAVENSSFEHRRKQSRNAMIATSHIANPDGSYTVTLSLSDGIGEIISMSLFAVDEPQALSLEKGFRANAEIIYNRLIMAILDS